jgi:hypothetical protein
VYVIRTHGGVGGGDPRGSPLSRFGVKNGNLMKEFIDFIASYPFWVKLATVVLSATIVLLLVLFRPPSQASSADGSTSSTPPPSGSSAAVKDKATSPAGFSSPAPPSDTGAPVVDKTNPLIVGNIQAKADGSTFIDISTGGRIEHVPITLIIDIPRKEPRFYDYSILFDITNKESSDLRIVDIFVRTLSWRQLEQIVRYIPFAGLGDTRKFLCIIDKEARQYRASFDQSASYLRLKPGELETIDLMLNARHEGKYSVQVELEYSVGGKTGTSVIGPINDIRFLDRGRIDVLPR